MLKLSTKQIRFLANGVAGKDESREFMRHFLARNGRALSTNGHVAYWTDHRQESLSEHFEAFDSDSGAPVSLVTKVPALDAVIPDVTKGHERIRLDDRAVSTLRLACAAAIGVTEDLERRWKREPRKTRSDHAPDAAVRLEAGEYGLVTSVVSQNRCKFSTRIDGLTGTFSVELGPNYLIDALDAMEDWALDAILLYANDSRSPVILKHEPNDLGASVLIMPRRF